MNVRRIVILLLQFLLTASVGAQTRPGTPVEKEPLPPLPPIKPLFDHQLRDTSICVGHDGAYFLTGTTGAPGRVRARSTKTLRPRQAQMFLLRRGSSTR